MNKVDGVDRDGVQLLNKAKAAAENRGASKEAQAFLFTGLAGKDIDTLNAFTLRKKLLMVTRMPNEFANAWVSEIKSGKMREKSADIKTKTLEYGTITLNGRTYVSDIDLMCIHKYDETAKNFVPIVISWNGRTAMTEDEFEYIGVLNMLLVSKLQHGCNDNYVANGRPLNSSIGEEFVIFNRGRIQVIYGVRDLRMYYCMLGLKNWHAEYGFPEFDIL